MTTQRPLSSLLVFEGVDGVGKSTIVAALKHRLLAMGVACIDISLPGKSEGSLGKLIYDLHHDPERFNIKDISPSSLQLLHLAAHVDAIDQTIKPALNNGQVVLLDRFWWSMWVYGKAAGVYLPLLDHMLQLEKLAWRDIQPTACFLLTRPGILIDPALDSTYAELAKEEAQFYPVKTISNDGTLDEIVDKVMDIALRNSSDPRKLPLQ